MRLADTHVAMGKTEATKKTHAPKLTRAQRLEMRSLIEDGGCTRAEALAWVTAFPVQQQKTLAQGDT